MNEVVIDNLNIENMIYEIRGKQVMFNSDVARLYNVETKRINEIIKRNINRFPEEFCFQITIEELEKLSSRSQFATLKYNCPLIFCEFQILVVYLPNNLIFQRKWQKRRIW